MILRHAVYRRARWLMEMKSNTFPVRMLSSESYQVIHDRQNRCFTVRLDDAGKVRSATLKYSHKSDEHVDLLSTDVPESFRGKGVAASLAKAALDFVVEERLKASISCWYIKRYVDENSHQGYQVHIED